MTIATSGRWRAPNPVEAISSAYLEMDYALISALKAAVIHTFVIASAKFLEHR
jgi:hypothetical protein